MTISGCGLHAKIVMKLINSIIHTRSLETIKPSMRIILSL